MYDSLPQRTMDILNEVLNKVMNKVLQQSSLNKKEI